MVLGKRFIAARNGNIKLVRVGLPLEQFDSFCNLMVPLKQIEYGLGYNIARSHMPHIPFT